MPVPNLSWIGGWPYESTGLPGTLCWKRPWGDISAGCRMSCSPGRPRSILVGAVGCLFFSLSTSEAPLVTARRGLGLLEEWRSGGRLRLLFSGGLGLAALGLRHVRMLKLPVYLLGCQIPVALHDGLG